MQLDYWTDKARIATQGRKQRVYDYDALTLVMLIKQARDKGLSLPAAIEAAREFMAASGRPVGERSEAGTADSSTAASAPSVAYGFEPEA